MGSAYRRAEFTRGCYCACATYLHVKLVHVAHVSWAQITKRAYFTKARIKDITHVVNRKLTQQSRLVFCYYIMGSLAVIYSKSRPP